MTGLPTFETARLHLRERSLADLEPFLAMDSDPEVSRHLGGPWPAAEHRAEVEDRIRKGSSGGFGWWSVFPKDAPDRFLGGVLLIPLAHEGPEIEIGWRFRREAWGNGYASEAAAAVLRYGLQDLGLAEVIAVLDPDNLRSRRVAERIGMRAAGQRFAYGHDLLAFSAVR